MKVETRQRIERQIARKAAKDLIAAGYKVAVFDGEEIALEASTDVRAIMAAMFSTDEDYLFAMTPGEDGKMKRAGWVRFIYGNMGFDVINDYTTNLEGALAETNALADQLETRHGYARVSTPEQDMSLQIDALERAGCSRIFQDVASGAKAERKGLDEALAYLRPGDTLVVWKIDRLGRSLAHLVGVVEDLRSRGIGFRSLTDPGMDTTTASGALIFHIFGALAAFERELIRERTKAGLAVAAEGQLSPLPC